MSYYILDENNKPIKSNNVLQWAAWFEGETNRIVVQDRFKDIDDNEVLVSTVFIGVDVMDEPNHAPYLWETMIFGGEHDQYQDRYCTYDDAVEGHKKALRIAKYAS